MCAMTTPKRIQRKRTKGWRMPEGAVYVGRPSRWGNPFVVGRFFVNRGPWADAPYPSAGPIGTRFARTGFTGQPYVEAIAEVRDSAHAVELFKAHIAYENIVWERYEIVFALAGRDLACWCPIEDANGNHVPCHADVLLELANGPTR